MAEKLKVELSDDNGNVYYLHTDASVVFCEDGTPVETKLNQMLSKSDIVQNATTAATDKVPSAAVAKNLQDQITQQNTKIIPVFVSNSSSFSSGWSGALTLIKIGYFFCIYGFVSHDTEEPPQWGDLVCKLTGYSNRYWQVIPIFQTGGIVFDTMAISPAGEIRVYSPDFGNICKAVFNTHSVIPNQPLIEEDYIEQSIV